MNELNILGRSQNLFNTDLARHERFISDEIMRGKFLVVGGAGSIGQAVCREIFKRKPLALHVVDINENALVELVRDIRSSLGYIDGDFRTFAIDCGSREFEVFMSSLVNYDYILNLSALKHVRSEKDPFTLMRLIDVNVFNTIKLLELADNKTLKKYFCVSTDKASNPVNMMGASKRIMEMFLMEESCRTNISMARFANVGFSDGSLLYGFIQRFNKNQPISVPIDIKRYFMTPSESGELCLMACLLGKNRNIFFPKLTSKIQLTSMLDIAIRFIESKGYKPFFCENENEAREERLSLISNGRWPCITFESDTTGEKSVEEFFTQEERLDLQTFEDIGVILSSLNESKESLSNFKKEIELIRYSKDWDKCKIVELFKTILPNFIHTEMGKYLDSKM
jgi:FlaA1/EpsC-like NDP-sugar epimerase